MKTGYRVSSRMFVRHSNSQSSCRRAGFSLVESLASLTIVAIAGSAVVGSVAAMVQTGSERVKVTLAQGIADQLMDEMTAVKFPDGVSAPASQSNPRDTFDDLEDFSGLSVKPPRDRHGRLLGTEGVLTGTTYGTRPSGMQPLAQYLSAFTQEVLVERGQPDPSANWLTSTSNTNYRRVTVTVKYTDAQGITGVVYRKIRVFSRYPTAP